MGKGGLFPFNPNRVLRDTPKPLTALDVPKACEVAISSYPEGDTVQTPVTPVTPSTTEALVSLQDLINQDACALDEKSRQRLRRHVEKFANAAKLSFAERALQKE